MWAIESDGTDARLSIPAPVEDWELVLDGILGLDPVPTSITLPSQVESGSVIDADMLQRLWSVLAVRGFTLQ